MSDDGCPARPPGEYQPAVLNKTAGLFQYLKGAARQGYPVGARLAFIRAAGTVHVAVFSSISYHLANRTSLDLAAVRSKNSRDSLVARFAADSQTC